MKNQLPDCTFWIVRHGQTNWNQMRRLQGHTDIPLNDHGRREAHDVKAHFANIDLACAYSSDLSRAYETAEIIAESKSIQVTKTSRLRERHYGEAEGKNITELEELFQKERKTAPAIEFKDFLAERLNIQMESKYDLTSRVLNELERLALQHPGKHILIVTHAGVQRALLQMIDRQHPLLPQRGWSVKNCAWFEMIYTRGIWEKGRSHGVMEVAPVSAFH